MNACATCKYYEKMFCGHGCGNYDSDMYATFVRSTDTCPKHEEKKV